MENIYFSYEQKNLIEKIRHILCAEYDIAREENNVRKPWKWNAIAFIDNNIYCYFDNGSPSKLMYGGRNLGKFSLTKTKKHVFNKKYPIEFNNEIQKYKTCHLKFQKGSDGCFSWDRVFLYDDNNNLIKEFDHEDEFEQ